MDFNIKDHIEKLRQKHIPATERDIISVISEYYPHIQLGHISYSKGMLFIKNIPPIDKLFIIKNKKIIIQKCLKKKHIVRDIL